MAISSLSSSSRIGGLASGLDTDQLVQNLMQIEQLKVDRVVQQRTKLEWTQTARKEILNLIQTFRDQTMSALSPNTNLNTLSAFNTFQVRGDGANTAVDLSATVEASAGTIIIHEISQLALPASNESSLQLPELNLSMTLDELQLMVPLSFGGANNEISFRINGETFSFSKKTTLKQMFSTINNSEAGVHIGYSELTRKISLQTLATGSETKLNIENLEGNFFGSDSPFGLRDGLFQNGQDAMLRINGTPVTRSENTFIIDGVRYNLVAETVVPLRFTIERNVDETVSRIQNFVDQYNKLNQRLNDLLNETQYRDFTPLTDAQKSKMSDKEIELWEEKAKSGLLRNDRSLTALTNRMRSALFESVDGVLINLSAIGITTGSYLERGQLHIDETKLRQALTDNPDAVMQLFMQTSEETDETSRYLKSGLLQRLRDTFSTYTGQYSEVQYKDEWLKISKRITEMNQSLIEKENQYWSRFAAMEKALSELYAQSNWLNSLLQTNQA